MVFEGVVTHLEIAPGMMGRYDGCTQMVTVENEAGNTVNFLMNASTFVVDYTTLYESMPVTVFYSGDTASLRFIRPNMKRRSSRPAGGRMSSWDTSTTSS